MTDQMDEKQRPDGTMKFVFWSLVLFTIIAIFLAVVYTVQAEPITFSTEGYVATESTDPLPMMKSDRVRNVVVMIGDGMAMNQVALARFTAVGPDGRLHMERFPVTGLMSTSSHDDLITDSAASGTALACGVKTNNRMIGQLPDGTEVESLTDWAEDRGMATGIIATSGITHATPAAYSASAKTRYMQPEIAAQYPASGIDLFMGGGMNYFIPQSVEGSKREDDSDIVREMVGKGYNLLRTRDDLQRATSLPVLGLFAIDALSHQPEEPSIAEMTEKALTLLSEDRDGFFLMVEGSQIDWKGHANDANGSIRETLDFDMAVKAASDFAQQNRETLVIVTADHECGGLTIVRGNKDGSGINANFSTMSHTPVPVPVFAFGPGAQHFTGVYENSDLAQKIAELLEFRGFAKVKMSKKDLHHVQTGGY